MIRKIYSNIWMDIENVLIIILVMLSSTSEKILTTKKMLPLVVENGKSVFLTQAQIPIDSKLKNTKLCQIEVEDIQPLSSAVGFFKPKKFPCFFEPNSVLYQHEGSPLLSSDTIILNIYYFRNIYSVFQNVSVHVKIIPPKLPSRVNLKSQLFVGSSKGISEAISSKILSINYNYKTEFCRLKHSNQVASSSTIYPWLATRYWPLTGLLITFNKSKVYEFNMDCQQALLMGYRFMHRMSRGPSVDFLPLIIEISEMKQKTIIDTIYLQVPIIIGSTSSDLYKNLLPPPVVETFRTARLKNSGGTISPLPKDILEIRTQDKNRGPLIAKIILIQGNDLARFVNLRAPAREIRSFTLTDLKEGLIGFQLTSYSETIEKVFRVDLIIYDSYFVQSDPVILKIVDELDNLNQPFQVFTTPLYTYTSNTRLLRYDNIQVLGQINRNLIKYRLLGFNSTIGMFYRDALTALFTNDKNNNIFFNITDIKSDKIFYKHHGGLEDTHLIRMEASIDRFRFIRFALPIHIVRVYNRTKDALLKPLSEFITPTEGIMPLSFLKLINWPYFLFIQRDNMEINFSITKEPKLGKVIKIYPTENVTVLSSATKTFNLKDLIDSLLYFQSSLSFSNNRDIIEVQQVGRQLHEKTTVIFNMKLYVNNFLFPKMDPNVVLKVLETVQYAKLSYLNLNFVNKNIQPYDIIYKITQCPIHDKAIGSVDSGRLISLKSIQNHLLIGDTVLTTKITDYKSAQITSITSFSQQQVLDNDIVYIPPIDDVGSQDQRIQFLYSVKDSYGYEIRNIPFNIIVKAVNNQAPFLKYSGATVARDEEVILSTVNIDIEDMDTNLDDLTIQVMKLPTYGRIINEKNVVLISGSNFSAKQLVFKNLRYKHNGYNIKEDNFKLRIFDGIQYSPTYTILINITKRILSNSAWNFYINNSIIVKENLTVPLHETAFQYVMKDFDFNTFSNPTFILVAMPTRGNLLKDNNVISTFYYEEIKNGNIKYQHIPTEIGSKAQFDFAQIWILESGLSFNMNFTILPVNSQSPIIYSQIPLQVNEGGFGIVSYYTLGAKDVDSIIDDIIIKVIQPPIWGKICWAKNRESSNTFSVADIRLGKILYVNNKYLNGLEQTNDAFMVQAFDGEFLSPLLEIPVVIHPTNDEIPKLILNDFNIAMGENKTLDERIFQISDADIPRDPLHISITRFPRFGNLMILYRHGELKKITKQSSPLTLQMLKFISILYSQTSKKIKINGIKFPVKDEFEFRATDGKFIVYDKCIVNITGFNVIAPVIFSSLIQLNKVAEKNITKVELNAKDEDTLPEDLIFSLLIAPKEGALFLSNVKLKINEKFSQFNINNGKIKYKYLGKSVSYTKDSFVVKVFDGSFQSNSKIIYLFLTQPIQKPKMIINLSPISVEIGQRFVLDQNIFKIENPIPEIFKLLTILVLKKLTCGFLYTYKNQETPLNKFTFEDVEKRNILLFIAECPDVVKFMNIPILISHHDKFEQQSNIHIQIIPRSKFLPVLERNIAIEVLAGSNVLLSKEKILVSDQDTESDKITFRYIKNNDSFIQVFNNNIESEIFTQYDINSNKVIISVPDFTNVTTEILQFHIGDIENEGYFVNSNLELNGILNVSVIISQWIHEDLILLRYSAPRDLKFIDGYNGFEWTFNNLLVSRSDAKITLGNELIAGFFYNIKTKQSLTSFSQIDINKGWIFYFLHKERSSSVHTEIIQFKILLGEFRITSERLSLKWSILEFEKSKYKLCPQRGLLSVTVLRKGDLTKESRALVGFISKEAILDQDYRLMSQRLLIFPPGRNNITVSIKILLTGTVPNATRFHVTLKSPKQTVFGQRSATIVTIKDRSICGSRNYFLPERNLKSQNKNSKTQEIKGMFQDVHPDPQLNPNKYYLPSSDQLEVQYLDYIQGRRSKSKCSKGWYVYSKRCYRPFTQEVSWNIANAHCFKLNSYMVSIYSKAILEYLLKLFNRRHTFWNGLHRTTAYDEWKYPNSEAILYTNWAKGFPKENNNKNRNCVIITKKGTWKNRRCDRKKSFFICMKNPEVVL